MPSLAFKLQATDNHSKARVGSITTDHGEIQTPIFMPVGTVGSVKAVNQQQLESDIKAQIILAIPIIYTCVRELIFWKLPADFTNSMAGKNLY